MTGTNALDLPLARYAGRRQMLGVRCQRARSRAGDGRGRAKAAVDAFLSVTYESFCCMIDEEAKDGFPANAGRGLADVQAALLAVPPADVAAVAVPTLVIARSPSLQGLVRPPASWPPRCPPGLVELDGSGHVTHLEKPDEFAGAVAAVAAESRSIDTPGAPGCADAQ